LKFQPMRSSRFTIIAAAAACLLTVAATAITADSATEGVKRTSAPSWLSLFGVAIRPDNEILVVGSKALLLTSTDQGKTWIQRTMQERPGGRLFQDRDLYSIRFDSSGKSGWVVGEEGIILHTTDGGDTWSLQKSGTTKNLFKIAVIDDKNVVVVGADGTILRTADGGDTWQSIKSPKNVTWFDVTFTDPQHGWMVGEFSTILASTDGGQTWTLNYGGNTGDFTIGPFFTVTFTDPQHGVVAGLAGDTAVTSDGGKTWQKQKLPDPVASYVVAEDPTSKALWAGGAGGRMFDQVPGGEWKPSDRATFHDLTDLAFAGKLGVAVGLNGTILLTDNAGEQWQAVQ
jgi:photosystem II stability/assembly factor-like uncharacterized protein